MRPIRSAIWSDPRVQPPYGVAELDPHHPLAQGLVALHLFHEGGGTTVIDATRFGNKLTGTHSGRVGLVLGEAAKMGGSSDGLSAADSTTMRSSSSLSAFCRFRLDSNQDFNPLMMRWADGATGIRIWALTGKTDGTLRGDHTTDGASFNAGNTVNSTTAMVAGKVYSAGYVHSASAAESRLYLNGARDGTAASAAAGVNTTTARALDVGFGTFADVLNRSKVTMQYAALYMRPLSDAEARWLHAEPYAMLRPRVSVRRFLDVRTATIQASVSLSGSLTTGIQLAGTIGVNVAAAAGLTTQIQMVGNVGVNVVLAPDELFTAKKAERLDECGHPLFTKCDSWMTKKVEGKK